MNNPTDQEKTDYPLRSRFRKNYQPYGVRICEETLDEIAAFDDCTVGANKMLEGEYYVRVKTREGELKAYAGDWIMEDSEGHHYPIAHEELRKTYEPVTDQS